MATGITRRHSRSCRAREEGRCNCSAGWEAWVYVARDGRKVRKTFRREAEARSWRADALAAANRGALRTGPRDVRTLAAALGDFIEGMKAGAVHPKGRARYKPATIRSYEQNVRLYVGPSRLGATRVTEVRRADVQAFVDGLLSDGLRAGTVSNVLNPVQAFYRRAQDREELSFNPSERIDLPTGPSKAAKRIARPEEAAALLAALIANDRPLWATAFYAGLRRGELQALRCLDVDLGQSLIRVERAWDHYEGPIDPKSESSRRTVPLLAVLRDYMDEHLLRTGRCGDALLFGRTASDPFVSSTIDNRAKRCWAAGELEAITLHECRHTFASLLIDAGANPKAIQTFMGHSKIQTTFDTYGHLLPGSQDEVRERMDAYLSAAAAGPAAA